MEIYRSCCRDTSEGCGFSKINEAGDCKSTNGNGLQFTVKGV